MLYYRPSIIIVIIIIFIYNNKILCGPRQLSRYSDSLWAEMSRDRIPMPARFSRPVLGPSQPPIQWVPGPFPRVKAVGAWR